MAKITIGGNVYGGGNAGNTGGSTSVTVRSGDINAVFGGARMANVGGSTCVNIDGEHASSDILISSVYGGNDISGTIGQSETLPKALENVKPDVTSTDKTKNAIDNSWNTFVVTSPCGTKETVTIDGVQMTADSKMLVIGSMFGGGNGEYFYRNEGDTHEIYLTEDDYKAGKDPIASNATGFTRPELGKTYLELRGGNIAHVYGGGNNATVTDNVTINIDNTSDNLEKGVRVWAYRNNLSLQEVLQYLHSRVGLAIFQSNLTSYAYNFSRIFGGNNKADMAIRPTWNLQKGVIRDLFSGGNKGAMTYEKGILLPISPVNSNDLKIENVFGGCRMADVNPAKAPIPEETINGTRYPAGYSARVLIEGGDINNVYGGNDISGNIYGGNAVGIHSSIKGNVYGGGNGSYAYTDNDQLKDSPIYGDFYYSVPNGMSSVEALRAFRPNAESVSIRLVGTKKKPTVIGGAVYCGGNSATLHNGDPTKDAAAELKIGSYVIADKVFLGNNGEKMKDPSILECYANQVDDEGNVVKTGGHDFSQMDLASEAKSINGRTQFDVFMDGVVMDVMPRVTFDDVGTYVPYSTMFGSLYIGGNVGSMKLDGAINVNFTDKVVIFDKVVGGSNEANVYKSAYNPQYLGGLLGNPDANGNKLIMNFNGLKIQPMRWMKNADGSYDLDKDGNRQLEWNTVSAKTGEEVAPVTSGENVKSTAADLDRRLKGGNIYGGCYQNGHVEGNVVINLNATIHERDKLFDDVENEGDINYENVENAEQQEDYYTIAERRTGVILSQQGTDCFGDALNVFGGGYGGDSEIWGSTTINLNKGYTFQIFGGGEMGAVGNAIDHTPDPNDPTKHNLQYDYNPAYSTYINLNGSVAGVARGAKGDSEDMAECEYLYGGAFEGLIGGDTHVTLNNGRIFNSFGGSCNADIIGHTETYVGKEGFPYVRDYVYGGNDLGGIIYGQGDLSDRISDDVKPMMSSASKEQVKKVAAYTEYTQGRVDYIIGGSSGNYDYTSDEYKVKTGDNDVDYAVANKPRQHNTFVNFSPNINPDNEVAKVFGGGEGYPGDRDGDMLQDHSYVLVDIPDGVETFANIEVFGAGSYNGLGMAYKAEDTFKSDFDLDEASAIIDLMRGQIATAYGGSYNQGNTRRTVVNVPQGSTIRVGNIFGGAYGDDPLIPCDVYESKVNYRSEAATVTGAVYGGNNHADRTFYGQVNIYAPVWSNREKGYLATVYGAGYGKDTWSQYTEVNLEDGARVYEAYGGGNSGKVLNKETLVKWAEIEEANGSYLDLAFGDYVENGLDNVLAKTAAMDGKKYNTNVHVKKGASVVNYCYGGGYGADAVVSGTTYIDLLGGTVTKDVYGAGTSGDVRDLYEAKTFTASANVFVGGGSARNVYGGGWKGDVGFTTMKVSEDGKSAAFDAEHELPGETHVVIGIRNDQGSVPADYGFYNGVPTIQRNAYGGGEGGAVLGNAYLTMNNGYIGYEYKDGTYQEKIDDETYYVDGVFAGEGRLADCGNLFGGGYDVKSSVDTTSVVMWGGVVRSSMHGGAEIATVGRGAIEASGEANSIRTLKGFYKAGKTHVEMYNGKVQRNVFGGGKGYNIFGYGQGQGTLYTDGYVFGRTEVDIYGGEIGTDQGLAQGYGNVFGGGDIGYVYSPSVLSAKTQEKINTGAPGHYYYYDNDGNLTEDCKVVIAPRLQVKNLSGATINGHTYQLYDYVATDDLNTLPKKNAEGKWAGGWENLLTEDADGERGIMIHNAVFGGGNVSSNNDKTYANATTVYGNATATLYDVFHRDFITVGTEHTGGLYGGGNLSVVDGYRELNITNYGTDYYGLNAQISLQEYRDLSNRERAYFQLEYVCIGNSETNASGHHGITIGGEFYEEGQHLTEEKYLKLVENYPSATTYWEPYGFCSIYAGRLLNTIQRADLCGVFGSRMVLQGAKDRVADVGENIDYTINRVGELSLNQRRSVIPTDTGDDFLHGNYFGIYSLVNHLGNLTSDVHFSDSLMRNDGTLDNDYSYFTFKAENYTKNNRNNGKSFNQVALASGVFLELTTENSTAEKKDYGYVSGVIELDLINVKQDQVGGGFVYAKNEHRVPIVYPNMKNVILSEFNKQKGDEAVTYKRLRYSATQTGDWTSAGSYTLGTGNPYEVVPYQTSGNFIHPTKRIIDDCYPINNAYTPNQDPYAEAHYWYVKGDVYIYEQKVSAYTGSATAYSKVVHLPLTITAASNGKLQLLDVKPNLYAYYANSDLTKKIGDLGDDNKPIEKIMVNNESEAYQLNDVITWWDWNNLSYNEKKYFVTMTYVNCVTVNVDGKEYAPGTYVMDDKDFTAFKSQSHTIKNIEGDVVTDVDEVFRASNNIGHDTGYVLTFDMNSPAVWDDYYTSTTGNQKISKAEYEALMAAATTDEARQAVLDNWRVGPTFTPVTSGVYGQRHYEVGEIITEDTYRNNKSGSGEQAVVERAYVAINQVSYTYNGRAKTINAGTAIPQSEYSVLDATTKAQFGQAWVCTSTVKLSDGIYVLNGDLKTEAEINQLKTTYPLLVNDINADLTPAYICSKAGDYGGQQYETGTNYSALKAWCSLPYDDRIDANGNDRFTYNHDALDLLSDTYKSPYSDQVNVEYQAVFKSSASKPTLTYSDGVLHDGDIITNEVFETKIRNDQRHYTRVAVKAGGETIYIANQNFVYNGSPYGKGQVVDVDVYNNNRNAVDAVDFENDHNSVAIGYYCYEDYEGASEGTTIDETSYAELINDQKYFVIQGREPTETTTLYVSRESDIYDVTKEKVYTVVYQYTYYEDEDDGSMKMTNELHVINVRLQLESGVPQIGTLAPPATVLPGTAIGLKAPEVTPGTYEVLTSGWELFDNSDDADHHRNGQPFDNGNTPVYWYQNGKNYVAFFSKTYLGKTYSNPVPLSVANYHNIDDVMKDKEHHMYVDKTTVDRPSKIYIDNRECSADPNKSGLDLFRDFYNLSQQTAVTTVGETAGHALLDSYVKSGENLEFFLNSNVAPKKYTTWVPIAGRIGECFGGNLHGDGYTVSGLSNSLFGSLCGSVYNLGVTGSFTSAGVADTGDGYVENCWVKSSAKEMDADVQAVFGKPTRGEGQQLVNSYYCESNPYSVTSNPRGSARKMTEQDFYDGTVAYNLNAFYLNKRYYDGTKLKSGRQYKYLQAQADGSLSDEPLMAYYPDSYAVYKLDDDNQYGSYVESRYVDGDYRYAAGSVPTSADTRQRMKKVGEGDNAKDVPYYTPIWPDDYIYFGQMLTYDYSATRLHEDVPSHAVKSSGRLVVSDQSNRVYRAPAYFGNSTMGVAHFNPWASLAAYSKAKSVTDTDVKKAYPGMTAIDFAGHNDMEYKQGLVTPSSNTQHPTSVFYPPLLDDDGLAGISNLGETRNLVVYAPAAEVNEKTYNALSNYFINPDFKDYSEEGDYYNDGNNYNRVQVAPTTTIVGHLVQSDLTTTDDHLLVDKQAFNAPIAYQMGSDRRMWYQRMPDNYAGQYVNADGDLIYDTSTGWEVLSLPFTAEMVSTQQKGELSHFYQGSSTGHEYWLREFAGNVKPKADAEGVFTADFNTPAAGAADKEYLNSFLWDYYYSKDLQKDKNEDQYQAYYRDSRTMKNYPYVTAGVPYLIGFPGNLYYEFDLSGRFQPENTYSDIDQLDAQTISFATAAGAEIPKTDDVLAPAVADQYQFVPSYADVTMTANQGYVMNSIGSSFDVAVDGTTAQPFRPYILPKTAQAPQRAPKSIVFNSVNTSLEGSDSKMNATETLDIYAQRRTIVVTSGLRRAADVRIFNVGGLCVANLTVEPGQTIQSQMLPDGVYIVNAAGGRYIKKLVVK